MRILFLMLVAILVGAEGAEAESPRNFKGQGEIKFRDAKKPDRYCTWKGIVAVRSLNVFYKSEGYQTAYTWTLESPMPVTPADADCTLVRPEFTALVRCFVLSTGVVGMDIPVLGFLQVTPEDPRIQKFFIDGSMTPNPYGFYGYDAWNQKVRLTKLKDGSIELFTFVPPGLETPDHPKPLSKP